MIARRLPSVLILLGGFPSLVSRRGRPAADTPAPAQDLQGIHKIQHIIIIMQENRSFDEYFGTFPGADGIPMQDGKPTVCVPDPVRQLCIAPYHDPRDRNSGGPHAAAYAQMDMDGGKMDGFLRSLYASQKKVCKNQNQPDCKFESEEDVL